MRIGSLWPPQRSVARLRAEIYRRRHVDEPWLTRYAIALLRDLLKPTDRCLEWGSGTGTVWLATRVGTLLSVEHDPGWFERVRRDLVDHRLPADTVRLLSTHSDVSDARAPYVAAAGEFADGDLDVCIVDGELRAECALAAIRKLAPGGLLLIDDAQGLLDHPSSSPYARTGRGALDARWSQIDATLRDWRLMWTSDGYSDTAMWIKPHP